MTRAWAIYSRGTGAFVTLALGWTAYDAWRGACLPFSFNGYEFTELRTLRAAAPREGNRCAGETRDGEPCKRAATWPPHTNVRVNELPRAWCKSHAPAIYEPKRLARATSIAERLEGA